MKTKERDLIISNLTVVSAKYGIKKGKTKNGKAFEAEEPTYQLSLKGEIPYENIWAFDETSEKLTPSWFKKADGYINLSSKYDIPVMRNGQSSTMSEWLDEQSEHDYSCNRSVVRVKIRNTDGAVYPVSLLVLKDGEALDPFEGMTE